MALTSIGSQLTPGRPTEVTLGASLGLPSANQVIALIGHQSVSGGSASGSSYVPVTMTNVVDPVAASGIAAGLFGAGSELAAMVVAAVQANQGASNFPGIIAIPLASTDTAFGSAFAAVNNISANWLVGPYDANSQVNMGLLLDQAEAMSGAQRVSNNQFGSFACQANRAASDPSTLFPYDSEFASLAWLRDSGTGPDASPRLLGEVAAMYAAKMAARNVPFNPGYGEVLTQLEAPAKMSDWITVGAGLESEVALQKGWSPLRVLPNGDVAIVRPRTTRITTDGITAVTAYFDVQDFDVLYFWRKTVVTRFNQPDFSNTKASDEQAQLALSEMIRLAVLFESQGMFQAVDELSKLFKVERNASDRSRFDVFTPVNVIPGLAVLATNVQGTTQGDTITV